MSEVTNEPLNNEQEQREKDKETLKHMRLPVCFYCNLPFDHEFDELVSPETQRLFIGYKPCNRCEKQLKDGFLIMGVVKEEIFPDQPPVTEENGVKWYPTQNTLVITKQAASYLHSVDPNIKVDENSPGIIVPDEFAQELIDKFKQVLSLDPDTEIVPDDTLDETDQKEG